MINEGGATLLMVAIYKNHPPIVERLLKDFNASPNIVHNRNLTSLWFWVVGTRGNLSILKLLTKYGFDYAKLVNKRDIGGGRTIFNMLCTNSYVDDPIACVKYLFQVCKKIPNCSINILAKNVDSMCGLHVAIWDSNADLVKYLLENVYFPNNDKSNPDGIAVLNMMCSANLPLAAFVLSTNLRTAHFYDATRQSEIFKLLISYGMRVNYAYRSTTILELAIKTKCTRNVRFMLSENLCPIYTLENLVQLMYAGNDTSFSDEIFQALYNYGVNHNLIVESGQDVQIIAIGGCVSLLAFKTALSTVLAHHGRSINDLHSYANKAAILTPISQSPTIKPEVKAFIETLLSRDALAVSTLTKTTSVPVVLTCINNHEIKHSNDSKIDNYKQMCSVCRDNSDGSKLLSGFKCDECKSFVCDDCAIVQKISKQIDMIGNKSQGYELSILREVLQHKSNKKLIEKVKSLIVTPKAMANCNVGAVLNVTV